MDMDLIPGLPDDLGLECLVRVPHHHFSSMASVCRGWKLQFELPYFWRQRKEAGLTRKIVVMAAQVQADPTRNHGFEKLSDAPVYQMRVYEPETGYWAELPQVPGHSDGLPMFCQLVGVGLDLVVMGGWNPASWEVSKAVFIYNFVSGTWRRGADMPGCERSFFACASDGSRMVYVAGGHDGEKCASRSAMAYDVAEDRWIDLPDMARERDESKGVVHGGKFHVIGGYHTNMQGRFEATAEAFDIATWQWGPVQEDFLHTPMCPRNCVDNGDGEFFMAIGADVAALRGSTWKVVSKLPTNVNNIAYITAWPGKLLVIGSERFGEPYEAFLLDLKTYKWQTLDKQEDFTGHVQSGCCLEL